MKWLINALSKRLFLLIFLLMFGLATVDVAPVAAQEPMVKSLRQEDLDGDGQPDLTVIEAQIETLSDDVRVYDGADNMRKGTDWQSVTDFEDDTWVFDTLADGSAQLVIKFERQGQSVTAQLFTDQDGDNVVAHKVKGSQVTVTESAYPSLTATAEGEWLLPDGQLNWNVSFQTDGPVLHFHTYNLTDIWNRSGILALDGSPDVELEFKDQDRDGIPEYGLWRILAPTPDSWGSMRSWIWSNEGLHRPDQPSEFVFWPYLLSGNYDSTLVEGVARVSDQNYFDVPPAISIAFGPGTIRYFFFPGYPIEQGFHVHTLESFHKGELNYANFENIQAYYDLANDQDGVPELHIRHRYYAANDPYGWDLNSPVNEIRWSWNQNSDDGDLTFDYKLDLAGRHTITSKAEFPDFSYTTVPYNELRNWVTNNQWDYATFVASEAKPLRSTEGIYTWGAVETMAEEDPSTLSRYLAGEVAIDVERAFQQIEVGWRGEIAAELQARPYLYFSPIDRKLHLLKASQGVWSIDEQAEIRYANLDDDNYLDQWRYLEEGKLRHQLNYAHNYLIYAGEEEVLLKQANTGPSLFETLPPRDHSEWIALGEQLETSLSAPDDFKAMVEQFEGVEMRLTGAVLHDYRPIGESGFRFVLDLQADFEGQGEKLFDISQLSSGRYVVTYDGQFTIEPLTPAELSLAIGLSEKKEVDLNQPLLTKGEATNIGLEDAKGLMFIAEAYYNAIEGQSGEPIEIARQKIDVLSGETVPITFDWQPNVAGNWNLRFWLSDAEGNLVAEKLHSVPINQVVGEQPIFTLSTNGRARVISILSILSFALLMGFAVFRLRSIPQTRSGHRPVEQKTTSEALS